MATNAYLDRLDNLQDQKSARLQATSSLPLQRPLNKQNPGYVAPPKPEEVDYMQTPFGSNVQDQINTDDRFHQMFNQYTDIANGLKKMVDQGYMPMQIAQAKLHEYIQDTRAHFASRPAEPLDNPQAKQAVMGALQQALQQKQQQQAADQPQPVAPPDIPQQDSQEVDNGS